MQEFLLGRRRLLFGQHEVHFLCNTGRYCESIDETLDPAGVLDVHQGPLNDIYFLVSYLPCYQAPPSRLLENTPRMLT